MSVACLLGGCGDGAWNSPYADSGAADNVSYSSFAERPKHLDPARSYSSNEWAFVAQIYEPPLQFHYLKRPYQLVPLTTRALPKTTYLDEQGRVLSDDAPAKVIAETWYDIEIQPGILYQPHPAFARGDDGEFLYHALSADQLAGIRRLSDFERTGTRELLAEDYVYQIKRLAHPAVHSPILGIMGEHIPGLVALSDTLAKALADADAVKSPNDRGFLDLRDFELDGVEVLDRYTYRIKIAGKYPQLLYWLAMPFFSPMPVEAEKFYAQPGLADRNINLDWFPVGTGAYMLTENNPNMRMVLTRNPNFRDEPYPSQGEPGDLAAGLLADAGKPMPFIDKFIFQLEKENIPYWNKFLQGYYDASGISSDSFDQAIAMGDAGQATLTESMEEKGIRLSTSVAPTIFYLGFNMLDPVIGGDSERARQLRRAISIAVDYEEYISIFMNGRGVAAQGPLPPEFFGHHSGEAGINPYVYDWVNGAPQRKSIEEARALLREADYADGIDQRTGKPLVLHFDVTGGSPDDKARLEWFRKQFRKLNIQLMLRPTDYNRFQEKIRKGNAQLYLWGWNADYPDPENFLFLLYGPNGKVNYQGENASNYQNPAFDELFEQMRNMDNTPQRLALIDRMTEIVRADAPWLWGVNPKNFGLYHAWISNNKPIEISRNTMKYLRIDADLRQSSREQWNQPLVWPLWLFGLGVIVVLLPAVIIYRRKEHRPAFDHRSGEARENPAEMK
ncbi:MAG: ABC transporter substrate-binding protein [bacterium]